MPARPDEGVRAYVCILDAPVCYKVFLEPLTHFLTGAVLARARTVYATEALAPILRDNPRGVPIIRDELTGWVRSMNSYKQHGADREAHRAVVDAHPVANFSTQQPMHG